MKFLRSLIATLVVLSGTAVPAFAHTSIVSSNIEEGSQIEVAPASFDFSFGADIGLARLELERCCQSNANQSPLFANKQVLGDEKVAPLAKSGVSFLFEPCSGVDVPFEVEVIVH